MSNAAHTEPADGDEPFRLLVESIRDYAIFRLDPSGRVATWNDGAQRIKGYRPSDIIGKHFSVFYPEEAIRAGWPAYELKTAADVGRFEDEGWRVRKDGSKFWANVIITALRDHTGTLVGFAKVTRDLSDRREHEEALRQSEERFRLLVDGVQDYGMFMLDANGYVMTWNSGAQRITGYNADEIIGHNCSRFYSIEAIRSGWPEHELQAAAEQGRYEDQGYRLRKDGTTFWSQVSLTALYDDIGRLRGFAKLMRDLTERQRAEGLEAHSARRDELLDAERNARMEAQRAVRVKDEFLATLSHELRTPLNAILGWAQVLRKQGSPSARDLERGMEAIERNARAQVGLIDDLLDLSRIMAGRVRLDVQNVAMADVIRGAIDATEPTAHGKEVRIETVLDPSLGPVAGDPARLQQVVWNLLSNAVKFTPKGGRVTVQLARGASHVELTVSDTGIGITPEFLPSVFDRFSQKDSSVGRRYGGLGLGLAICKQLVELHGGRIQADSAGENRGASFVVQLPLSLSAQEPAVKAQLTQGAETDVDVLLPQLQGVRVAVVDDELDSRELIRHVLKDRGAEVTVASSAAECLELLRTSSFDVLLSDIGMPGMDGYQLMRRIRASESTAERLPALALTAFARPEDRKKALLSGYQSHLAKPFDIAELVIVVAGLAGRTSQDAR